MPAGTALVITCAALGWGTVRLARRGRLQAAALLLVLIALLLRGFAAADPHLHEWDEKFHAVVAKNLLRHPLRPTLYDDPVLPHDHRDWFASGVWLHKPPLALWTMAASLRVFGAHELAVRLPSVVLGSLAVLLTVRLGTMLYSAPVGLLAGFLHAINGFLIELAAGRRATDHVDALFITLVEAGAVVTLGGLGATAKPGPGRAALVGLLVGLAVLAKWLAAGVVLAVWAVVAVSRGGRRTALGLVALASGVAALVAAPWFIHTARAFPAEYAWERAYDLRHFVETLEGHRGGPAFHLLQMPFLFGEIVYLPLSWHTMVALRRRDPRDIALLAWWVVPYAVFSAAATKMPGYVMVAAPALFLIVARFAEMLAEQRPARPAARIARVAIIVLLVGLPVRYAFERVRPFRSRADPAWAHELRALGRSARPPCVIFGTPRAIEAMFYTPCTAYPYPAGPEDRAALTGRGYEVYPLER